MRNDIIDRLGRQATVLTFWTLKHQSQHELRRLQHLPADALVAQLLPTTSRGNRASWPEPLMSLHLHRPRHGLCCGLLQIS